MTDYLEIPLDQIQPGMMLKLKTARGSVWRKVYKVNLKDRTIWGICIWPKVTRQKEFEIREECCMTENGCDKFNSIGEFNGQSFGAMRLRIT